MCIGVLASTKVYSRLPGPQFLHCIWSYFVMNLNISSIILLNFYNKTPLLPIFVGLASDVIDKNNNVHFASGDQVNANI